MDKTGRVFVIPVVKVSQGFDTQQNAELRLIEILKKLPPEEFIRIPEQGLA